MGLAIIGFSFALRFLLNPLTKPYMQSMKRMKDFEPQLAKLKERHKDDKKKLMEAQTEFYKQKGINPGAGCLPYLLQIVVLIALFNVFTRVLSPNGDVVVKFNELLYSPLRFVEGEALNTRFLYLDITKPDCFGSGKCLPIPFKLPFPLPGPILIFAALLQFASAKMMTPFQKLEEKVAKKTKGATDDLQISMQKSMSLTFPLFTLIFGLSFPSGLALYWLLFSLFQLLQQYKTSGWGGLTPLATKIGLLKGQS